MARTSGALLVAGLLCTQVAAQSLKVDSHDEIIKSTSLLAEDLMTLYKPGAEDSIPGLLPGDEYWWWQSGLFMTTFIDYWRLSGDSTYNEIILEGMLHQRDELYDFFPVNQTAQMTNDDHCTWGLAAMLAVENDFPSPPEEEPQWLDSAQMVFEEMTLRLDNETCGGGLRWQVFSFNLGYDWKDTISNGCYLNLGARLLRYTGNETYAGYVNNVWQWMTEVGLLKTDTWEVYEGVEVGRDSCEEIDMSSFSLPQGLLIHTAASMYNHTDGSDEWRERLDGLIDRALMTFFPNDVAFEVECEIFRDCRTDQITYKGNLIRFLAAAVQLAPHTAKKILPTLKASAKAAVSQCTGGDSGRRCGFYWSKGEYEEPFTSGVGEQMNALSAVSNLLIQDAEPPAKSVSPASPSDDSNQDDDNGGESSGGSNEHSGMDDEPEATDPPSAAARQGLGVFSAVMIVGCLISSILPV
ncbi:Mannan endo-1,6-alpha-mannosidase DCW1 [Paramyrothecium foliicola]|nr:Mannan endo-1,6-alpha-mannosidase DCW1 [Paramyrothecium foliicola]